MFVNYMRQLHGYSYSFLTEYEVNGLIKRITMHFPE
jgi:hypothetical protein